MRINHNLASLNTYRQLSANGISTQKSLEKLSSGLRINRAGDDAAGLAISEKMRGQIRGLDQSARNAQDGISLIQTAEGALSETHSILQRMRELAVQASNDTNTDTDRNEMQKEINQLTSEINRIGNTTEFNTMKLLDGSRATGTGKELGATITYSNNHLENLSILSSSTLDAKDYKIEITNEAQTIQNLDTTDVAATGLDSIAQNTPGADMSLSEGMYKIAITSQAAKSATDLGDTFAGTTTAGSVAVFNTAAGNQAITIDAGSTLADATGYYVQVDKTVDKQIAVAGDAGTDNLALVLGSEATEGSYQITTSALGTAAANFAAGDAAKTVASIGMSNIKLDADSTYDNGDAYQINVELIADAAGKATYEFSLANSGGTVAGTAVSVDVTASSGTTSMRVGDVTFDINLATLWGNSDHDADITNDSLGADSAGAIDLTIQNQVKVTQWSTGTAITHQVNDGADSAALEFDFGGANGKLTLDVTDTGDEFTRGSNFVTNVTWTDKYDLTLHATAGGAQVGAAAATITEDDLSDPANLTNVVVGDAAHGVFVDLSAVGLNAMTEAGPDNVVKMDFTVDESVQYTAEIQNMDGTTAGVGTFALTGANTDIGGGVKVNHSDLSALVDGEEAYFTVVDNTEADDLRVTLKQDSDDDGIYDNTLVDKQRFDPNDDITLDGTGVTIGTTASVAAGDNVTFSVEAGEQDNSLKMQIGANSGQSMAVDIRDMKASALEISATTASTKNVVVDGVTYTASYTDTTDVTNGTNNTGSEKALDVSDGTKATAAIKVIDEAIREVSAERSKLGAFQNRLEHTINNLGTTSENMTAAESRIRDVDMAKEMMEFTKNNILSQAAQAMLAQANQQPQGVLQLLR